jgi:hypothetical protein
MSLAIPVALAVLATIDSAFVGYRVAAGRNALIRKQRYYRTAMLRGAVWGQAAIGVALVIIALLIAIVRDRDQLIIDLEKSGRAMLLVYVPYAAIIAIGFGLRLIRSVDIRCLTSTLIFGPLVLLRPPVALAGALAAVAASPRSENVAVICIVLTMMLGLEPLLNRTADGAVARVLR